MNTIYDILPKYFSGEASPEENKVIADYKKKHAIEFEFLLKVWEGDSIKVHEFDSNKAVKKIKEELESRKKATPKIVPFYLRFTRIAAVFILLLCIAGASYFSWQTISKPEFVQHTNTSMQASELLLPDGTQVWLNKGATVSFPEKFKNSKREVQLSGEAFFQVQRDVDRPFLIHAENAVVEVLGTSFNVVSDKEITTVDVTTGKVMLSSKMGTSKTIVTRGLSALVENNIAKQYTTTNLNYISWKTGIFIFSKTPLEKVVQELNSYYEKPIVLDDNLIDNNVLTFRLDNASIDEVLEIIQLTCELEIEDKGNSYLIR